MVSARNWSSSAPGVWHLDRVHYAHPVPRLYAELFPAGIREGSVRSYRRYGLLTDGLSYQFVNGFGYAQSTVVADPDELRHRADQAEATFELRRWRDDVRRWRDEVLPAAVRAHLALVDVDPAQLPDADLATYLRRCMDHFQSMVAQHHDLNPTVVVPVGDFLVHACDWTGCSTVEAFGALAGHSPASRGASAVTTRAAQAIDADAAARVLLHTAQDDAGEVLRQLLAAGGDVSRAVERFLAHEGHRLVGGFDLGCPTALEVPQVLVAMLRGGLEDPSPSSENGLAELRRSVPARHLAEFDEMFADASTAYGVRDERGVFTDTWAGGILRRALLAAGKRLVAAGVMVDPEHAMEATPDELLRLTAGSGGPSGTELSARAADRAAAADEEPPAVLGDADNAGGPAVDTAGWPPPLQRMWRAMRPAVAQPESRPSAISGVGVGRTSYEGPARLITDLADLGRTQPGDVLVTITTTEALNIVGALLGALVTDFGGALSHAAITAREWGIPAVVGCGDATKRIPDGATVRVDAIAGEVVVLATS